MLRVLFALLFAETQASDFAKNKQEDFKIEKDANNEQMATPYKTYSTQESGASRGLFNQINNFKINDDFTDDDKTISNSSAFAYVDSDFSKDSDLNYTSSSNTELDDNAELERYHDLNYNQDTKNIIRNDLNDKSIEKNKINNTMSNYLDKNVLGTGDIRVNSDNKINNYLKNPKKGKIKKIIKTPKQIHTGNIKNNNQQNTDIKQNLDQISNSDEITVLEDNYIKQDITNSQFSDIESNFSYNTQNKPTSINKKYAKDSDISNNSEQSKQSSNSVNDITHLITQNDADENVENLEKKENAKAQNTHGKNNVINNNKSNKLKVKPEKQNDWYALNNKLDSMKNKKGQMVQVEIPMTSTLLKDVITYVQNQIENDEKINKIKDSNFDIIQASQEEIIGIIGNYENNNIVFNHLTTAIATIKSIIDLYTTIFQGNKQLNEKLSQITKLIANGYNPSVEKLFNQFQSNAYILNLIKLIFASDNDFLKNVQLQPSSKYLPEPSAKNLIENYLKGVYPITSSNETDIYNKFLDELSAKLRTSIDIFPTKFIFTLCQVLMDFSNTYLSQLMTANTNFKGQCVIFKQKISELPSVTDPADIKFVAKLKMYVSELEKYQNEISSKTDNIINLIKEIIEVLLKKFSSYVPDTKIIALNTN